MRILVVEDDPVVSGLMGELIAREEALVLVGRTRTEEDALELVGSARRGAEAVRTASRLRPDLVVLDLHLPDMTGFELMQQLEQGVSVPRFLVVSENEQVATQLAAVRAGARGVVAKTALAGRLADAIRAIARGETWFSAEAEDHILREYRQLWQQSQSERRAPLTDSERAMLVEVVKRRTDGQIAAELGVSIATVKARLRNALRKMDLPARTVAAVLATRDGQPD